MFAACVLCPVIRFWFNAKLLKVKHFFINIYILICSSSLVCFLLDNKKRRRVFPAEEGFGFRELVLLFLLAMLTRIHVKFVCMQ